MWISGGTLLELFFQHILIPSSKVLCAPDHMPCTGVRKNVPKHSLTHNLQVGMMRWPPQLVLGSENAPFEVSISPARVPGIGVFSKTH